MNSRNTKVGVLENRSLGIKYFEYMPLTFQNFNSQLSNTEALVQCLKTGLILESVPDTLFITLRVRDIDRDTGWPRYFGTKFQFNLYDNIEGFEKFS